MPRRHSKEVVQAPALPLTNETLRIATKPPTLLDHMKAAIKNGAWGDLHPLINATTNDASVHGTIRDDNTMAAFTLQEYGREKGIELLAEAKVSEIRKKIAHALRAIRDENDHRIDRKSRLMQAIQDQRANPDS